MEAIEWEAAQEEEVGGKFQAGDVRTAYALDKIAEETAPWREDVGQGQNPGVLQGLTEHHGFPPPCPVPSAFGKGHARDAGQGTEETLGTNSGHSATPPRNDESTCWCRCVYVWVPMRLATCVPERLWSQARFRSMSDV